MSKKFLASIVAVVVALGISLPLALGGSSRPTPEQYFQSLVSQHLTWQNVKGVETAYDHARALEFQVSKKLATVLINTNELQNLNNSADVGSRDLYLVGAFLYHYAQQAGEVSGVLGFAQFVMALQTDGPLLFLNNSGTLNPSLVVNFGKYGSGQRSLFIGGTYSGSYIFAVSI